MAGPAPGIRSSRSLASRKTFAISRDFTLGVGQAEIDPMLHEAFLDTGAYSAIASIQDRRCFLIGRTGSGKSAVLQRLEEEHDRRVVRIDPEHLSLTYISDLQIINRLYELGIQMDPFFIALWKHLLMIEIIKHRYGVNSAAEKQNFLDTIRQKISRDPGKLQALDYLDEFQDRFWCESDERVREIISRFENRVDGVIEGKLGAPGASISASTGDQTASSEEVRVEINKIQRVVNETQLPRLNQMIRVLDQHILDDPAHFTYVVIDDLDRDWVDTRVANDLIRCLFRAVIDLLKVQNLKILVALRVNIFQELQYEKRIDQEEKLRALVLDLNWRKTDLRHLLDARVEAAANRHGASYVKVKDVLPGQAKRRGNPFDYISSRSLMRPRDVISFTNLALAEAVGKTRISWDDLQRARHPYSEERFLALRDEWKGTYPDIGAVLECFRESRQFIDHEATTKILDDVALLQASPSFEGTVWLSGKTQRLWDSGLGTEWVELYGPLVRMLYEIGFLGVDRESRAPVFVTDRPTYLDRTSNIRDTRFVIHPAFCSYLEVEEEYP